MKLSKDNEAFLLWVKQTRIKKFENYEVKDLYTRYTQWFDALQFPYSEKFKQYKYPFYKFKFYMFEFLRNPLATGSELVTKEPEPVLPPFVKKEVVEVVPPVIESPIIEPTVDVLVPDESEPVVVQVKDSHVRYQHASVPEHIVNEQEIFDQIVGYVQSVCDAQSQDFFLIISGDAGLGKSFEVKKTLAECLGSESHERLYTDHSTQSNRLQWIEGPTKIPPKELYCFLWKENQKVILLDDADDCIENPTNINIFKKILDSTAKRKVGYGGKPISVKVSAKDEVLVPNSFEFEGRMILITNKYFSEIHPALVSRALVVEVDLPYEQTVARVERLLPHFANNLPGVTNKIKRDVVEFLKSLKYLKKLDMRTTEQAIAERIRNPDKWQRLVEKSIRLKSH